MLLNGLVEQLNRCCQNRIRLRARIVIAKSVLYQRDQYAKCAIACTKSRAACVESVMLERLVAQFKIDTVNTCHCTNGGMPTQLSTSTLKKNIKELVTNWYGESRCSDDALVTPHSAKLLKPPSFEPVRQS